VKTTAGRRAIVFMPQLARVMREHKLHSPFSAPTDYVFANPDGRARDHRSTSKGIERAVERAKLGTGISAHSFRHTFASMLIVGLKYDPVSVSRQLGHEKASFTQDTYAHLFDKAKHADMLRDQFEAGFGHLLADVKTVSTGGGNQPQQKPRRVGRIAASVG
jgi:integrase